MKGKLQSAVKRLEEIRENVLHAWLLGTQAGVRAFLVSRYLAEESVSLA